MNKRFWMLFSISYTILCLLSAMLLIFHAVHEASYGMEFLMGPANMYYTPLEMVWWLFLFTPVWAVSGWILDMSTKLGTIEIYRYQKSAVWWLRLILRIYGVNVWYFLILYVGLLIICPALANIQVLLCLMLHALSMAATMIWIWLYFKKVNMAFLIVIIIEGIGKLPTIAGGWPMFNPLVWGMYGFSKEIYGLTGFLFSLSAASEIVYILLAMIIPLIFRKLILRGVL